MSTFVGNSRKRRRTTPIVVTASQKRPIDKRIIFFDHSSTAASAQLQTAIIPSATFPCTATGIRWEVIIDSADALNAPDILWAIVILREGVAADTLTFSGAAAIYTPEQNVLAWGYSRAISNASSAGPELQRWDGTTKTMRKLMAGDQIVMISKPNATWTGVVRGVVQIFCKS